MPRSRQGQRKESKENESVLTDVVTCWDSESPEESGEAAREILNSSKVLLSQFSGAGASITESISSLVFEEIVYGVPHETKPPHLRTTSHKQS
jgi:hypothetical protein